MLTNPFDGGGGGGERLGGSGGSGFDSASGNSCGGARTPGGCMASGLNCGFLLVMVRVEAMGADAMICRWSWCVRDIQAFRRFQLTTVARRQYPPP